MNLSVLRTMSAMKFCAKHFAKRARKARTESDRARLSKAAEHYRELAKLEDDIAGNASQAASAEHLDVRLVSYSKCTNGM